MKKEINKHSEFFESRQIRVFISSTFRDMQAERDYLVKHVFPELKRRCRQRQVDFVEVDLRWGVTEAQAERGEVLPVCLAEIENCRPYFIGLLGERYGWLPDTIDPELLDTRPWLSEHTEKSVTELEILHGVLNNPDMADRAHFYFRDPAYVQKIPADQRKDYVSEDEASRSRIEELKDQIRQSGLPVRENYPDPEAAGRLILEDLWQAIDEAYPKGSEPDLLDQETAGHEAFAQSRARVYISRRGYFDRLDAHVNSQDQPLVLLGESGTGKSALVANWVIQHRKDHPQDFIFLHFIGSTPGSTDYAAIIRRLMEAIKRRYNVEDEIPAAPKKMREELPMWLARVRDRMVLVIDGLNQLEEKDNAPHLGWLPEYFPPHIRVIASTLPGPAHDAIKKRNWPTCRIEGFNPAEQAQMIQEYLGLYRKTLDDRQIKRITAVPQSTNPLYLKVLLEELRIFGKYEELDSRIDDYLSAPDVLALYDKILTRLEKDYEKEKPGLTGEALSLIWAGRRGLSESELLDIMGTEESPLPRAIWSPLFLALEDALVNRSGLLGFFHDYLRQAVYKRYIQTGEREQSLHLRLADYFDKQETDDRKVDELPWQLCEARQWERLKDCLTDMDIFLRLMNDKTQYELMGYWLAMGDRFDMVAAYNESVEQYKKKGGPSDEQLSLSLDRTARFLQLNARYEGAEPLYRQALEIWEKVLGPQHPQTAASLNNLAELLGAKGAYEKAEPLYRRAIEIWEKVLGPQHPYTATSLNNLAGMLYSKGAYAEAEALDRRALEIREKVLGPEHPYTATSLNNLAELLRAKGAYEEAEPLYRRALEIWEKALGPEHPNTAAGLNSIAALLYQKGAYAEAEALDRRALEIREKVLGPEHPYTATSLNNLAELLRAKGAYEEAEPLYRRALEIREKVLGPEHPYTATSLNNLAGMLYSKGAYEEVEPLYRQALEIWEKVLGPQHPQTAASLNNLAGLLRAKGAYEEAEPLYRQALEISERVLGPQHSDTAQSLNNLALLLYSKGAYEEAEPLYRRALEIREKALGPRHPDTAQSLSNLAGLLRAKGAYEEAEPPYRRALEIREKVLGPQHPYTATSLNNLALLLYQKGAYEEAEPLYRRAIEIWEKVLGPQHPQTAASLNNLAELLRAKGAYEEAEPLYRQALEISERVLGPQHPQTAASLGNLALLLRDKKDHESACKLFEEFARRFEGKED